MLLLIVISFFLAVILSNNKLHIGIQTFIVIVLIVSPQLALPRFGNLPVLNITRTYYLGLLSVYLFRLLNKSYEYIFIQSFPLKKQVVLYIIFLAITSLFGENFVQSFLLFLVDCIESFILFFIVWRGVRSQAEAYEMFKKLSFLFILICFYGIYTYLTNSNPYLDFVHRIGNTEDISTKIVLNSDRGLQRHVNSIFYHPVEFAAIISTLTPVLFFLSGTKRKFNIINITYLILPLLLVILTGSRSLILSTSVFVIGYIYFADFKKKFLFIIIFIVFNSYFLSKYEVLVDSTFHFWENKSGVSGSSYKMRLVQFEESIELLKQNILFGHGYKYNAKIMGEYGFEDLKGFESIIFQILINNGVIGLLAYIILFGGLFKYYLKNGSYIFLLGLVYYIIFISLTGPMSSFPIFIIVNTIAIRYIYDKKNVGRMKIFKNE